MNTPLINEYITLKLEITEREARAESIKPQIIEEMQKEEADQLDHASGTLLLQSRRTWTYPEDIQVVEQELKENKKKSEQIGEATYIEKPVLVFKVK